MLRVIKGEQLHVLNEGGGKRKQRRASAMIHQLAYTLARL